MITCHTSGSAAVQQRDRGAAIRVKEQACLLFAQWSSDCTSAIDRLSMFMLRPCSSFSLLRAGSCADMLAACAESNAMLRAPSQSLSRAVLADVSIRTGHCQTGWFQIHPSICLHLLKPSPGTNISSSMRKQALCSMTQGQENRSAYRPAHGPWSFNRILMFP